MDIIRSVNDDQGALLADIARLFCGGRFDCDVTYSTGGFYKDGRVPEPQYKFDLAPQAAGVIQADSRRLPLADGSISSAIFDPPFVASTSHLDTGIIRGRFSCMPTILDLWAYYRDSLKELHRILKPHGILVFKCQDVVHGRRNWFSHCEIMQQAIVSGFYPRDLFILVANNRLIRDNLKEQQHARKFHSYFWVFEKKRCTINYTRRADCEDSNLLRQVREPALAC